MKKSLSKLMLPNDEHKPIVVSGRRWVFIIGFLKRFTLFRFLNRQWEIEDPAKRADYISSKL